MQPWKWVSPEQLLRPDYPVHRMPVMSNWPGPNCISPSVEEHAATDGENLVKSENTSTEDVVLVQPLDNLPEQQQQQQQQQRPDYPVLSGIMCDWERRTESRGSCDSGVSFKSDESRELIIDFKKRSPFRRKTESRGSCDSGVSFKSDWSRELGIDFKKRSPFRRRTESRESCKSSVSFKSDRSRELGIDFKRRSPFSPEQLLRPDYPVHRMPVMSNWPGPNCISPSVEEHAATDGENLVKSENTSTEDVVLVQPLDNLPEQQQQQQQRPDYPVLSGIMCDWERKTESRGSCDSGVSFKSDWSRELGIDFKKRSPFRRKTESRGSCDSGVSFKSDQSRELGINFKRRSPFSPEQLLRPDYPVHRMPVMSNWPGPNCISPSVEEHAATDGENLVKSENTSTEDVVLVQPLDNLPEQQQQQQQQQRPDYPVLSGIMCDWEMRTESRGSCDSGVSFKSDESRDLGIDFKKRSPFRRKTESRGSCDSGVSFKSDQSRELGINFKKRSPFSPEQLLRPDYPVHRMPVMSNWPGPNCISPSVEEHAATDGENLVKSENTSTEDVVLVQPLDNLPEQQQQQQQQQRPDYPVLSGIMCDWEMRTESRGSCDSGVSFKSDESRELGIDFKKRSPFRRRTESRESCKSSVSFKSDRSRKLGIDFKRRSPFSPEQLLRPDYPVHRMPVMSNWPGPNCISPSVEEHAATDGENLVKSENTSTEDVVLVQP